MSPPSTHSTKFLSSWRDPHGHSNLLVMFQQIVVQYGHGPGVLREEHSPTRRALWCWWESERTWSVNYGRDWRPPTPADYIVNPCQTRDIDSSETAKQEVWPGTSSKYCGQHIIGRSWLINGRFPLLILFLLLLHTFFFETAAINCWAHISWRMFIQSFTLPELADWVPEMAPKTS